MRSLDRYGASTDRTSARSLIEYLRVQSLGRMYSRRRLKLSQSLSQILIIRMLSLHSSLQPGRPNTLFKRQLIVYYRSQN
jgi:hypothetical protein